MFSITFKRPLVTLAVVSGLLVAAAPASAEVQSPKDQLSGIHLRYSARAPTATIEPSATGRRIP
jgi:hypothetical protein